MKSWKAEVIADGSGKFNGNALRFREREEAEDYARDLMSRWLLVTEWRVVESPDPVNYKFSYRTGLEAVEYKIDLEAGNAKLKG